MRRQPTITVAQPGPRILPTGAGIGATQDMCLVMSPKRAASLPSIFTVKLPRATSPGPPLALGQPGMLSALVLSPLGNPAKAA